MNPKHRAIVNLANGERSSKEIAAIVGLTPRYVRRLMHRYDLPRLPHGGPSGERNGSWAGGRHVDLDGYVTVPAPDGGGRAVGRILEHRLVLSRELGRPLQDEEVVDHIDGLTLHNAPENLRLFATNGEHLRATISGRPRAWSRSGHRNIGSRCDRGRVIVPVDIYRQRKARGDVRLLQILRAALSLGTDSPYLSGTHRHLEQAGIDPASRPSLERALADLERRFAQDLAR